MTLILDWDGTVTVDDTLILALREFGDWQIYLDAAAALRRGEITLHEEIRRDAESIRTPIEEVVGWLRENLEVRPGFHELAEAYRPLIVSSNFRQLIEPILEREGVELEVRANNSDRCAAQAADRIFARDSLAHYLDEQGVSYEPFGDLHDVARSLA